MPTDIPPNSPLARKLFSVATFAQAQRQPGFRKNLTGTAPMQNAAERKLKGQTTPGLPFIRVTDLAKTAGNSVTVDLFNIIQGKPIMGDRKVAGKGMSLTSSTQEITINQARAMVDPGGRMTQQRTLHNLRTLAQANLSGYASRLEDQLCLVHSGGSRGYDNGADWVVPLASDPDFNDIVVNTVNPPTPNRRVFAGNATTVSGLATTDQLNLSDIDRIRAQIDEMVFPMQPIEIPGDPANQENPLYCLYVTSRQWHWLQTNTGAGNWRTFLSNAYERSRGFQVPLFMGTPGMWNGILIKKLFRPIRFPAGSLVQEYNASMVSTGVAAAVDVDRGLLFGAQALAMVYGRHQQSDYFYSWNEEMTDHGNTIEISIAMMAGKSKLRFKDVTGTVTDNGVMTVDSYAPAP